MDLINRFLNLVLPTAAFFTLLFLAPPLYFSRFFLSFLSSLFSEDLTHKVVLITGASSGIGEQLAYQYAKKGASLVVVARREGSLREVAERARDIGSPDVLVVPADVAKPDDCRRFVDAAITRFGRLDHLIVNAGIGSLCLFEEASDVTNFRPVMDINFWGSTYASYYALPHLKKTGGRIVVNASASARNPMPRMSFYNASKAAVMSFYETLRVEMGDEVGLTVATPGWIESEMSKGKYLSKEGEMEVNQEMRDAQVGLLPVEHAEACARAMVEGACRGERYVTVPAWFKVMFLWRVVAPEVMDWWYRMMYVAGPGWSAAETRSKRLLDWSVAKHVLHPSSLLPPPSTRRTSKRTSYYLLVRG